MIYRCQGFRSWTDFNLSPLELHISNILCLNLTFFLRSELIISQFPSLRFLSLSSQIFIFIFHNVDVNIKMQKCCVNPAPIPPNPKDGAGCSSSYVTCWFEVLFTWATSLFLLLLVFRYYEGLQNCVGLSSKSQCYSSEEIDRLESLYKSLGQQYNRSSAVKVTQPLLFWLLTKLGLFFRMGVIFFLFWE